MPLARLLVGVEEITSYCDSWNTLDEQMIMLRQLPLEVKLPSGGVFAKPEKWRVAASV
jgi:hypothetical protein